MKVHNDAADIYYTRVLYCMMYRYHCMYIHHNMYA